MNASQSDIPAEDLIQQLVCMDAYSADYPIQIALAYAQDDNLLFGQRIYKKDAKLWLHADLAQIVLKAAQTLHETTGYSFVLYDGLRTVDAQAAMLKTQRVIHNPHWLEEPRLLSPPGAGAHPRGMAIDLSIMDEAGNLLDMGTEFDFLAADPSAEHNPAHRDYTHNETVQKNRNLLNTVMCEAADTLGLQLWPLPQEWWDFRFPPSVFERYPALRETELPVEMRVMD